MLASEIRKPVITAFRRSRHGLDMAKKDPSERARAFKKWMARAGTNTKRVSEQAGVTYTTLASFVQGDTRSLKGETEQKIAQAFEEPAEAIFGGGHGEVLVRIIGRVGANPDDEIVMTSAHEIFDFALPPPGGTSDSVALEVKGHSMRGYADDGSLIYFEIQRTPPTPDMLGAICIVETEDGRVLLKRLLRGSGPGLYDLESANGPAIPDVRLRWAAEPTAIIPPRHAQRIIRRSGEHAA